MQSMENKGATLGAVDVLKHAPIVITPAEGEYSTTEIVPPQYVANWQARGMTMLAFTPDQLDRMRQLRDCSMEYAAISGNKYIPLMILFGRSAETVRCRQTANPYRA